MRELYVNFEPQTAVGHWALLWKVWESCISIIGGAGTLFSCIHFNDRRTSHTTLFAIKGSNNKKQTKQRKRSKINHCKIGKSNTTGQHNSILGLIFSTQSTNDIIGYGELAQKIRFLANRLSIETVGYMPWGWRLSSVTFRCCLKTIPHIIILSSRHESDIPSLPGRQVSSS